MPTLRARVLTCVSADELTFLDDAVVCIDGAQIAEVAPYDGRPVDEDLRPGVLLPGFVDAHVHYPQTRIVGSASGPLLQWLERSTFPEEARFADEEHAQRIAATFVDRLAAAGTTLSMVYGSVHPAAAHQLFAALAGRGLKAIAGPVLMDRDCPPALQLPADPALAGLEALRQRWHGHDAGRLQLGVFPRFALSCSAALMERAGAFAAEHELFVSTHLAETPEECRVARERFSAADYLEVYERAGLVHARAVFAHCVHLSPSEWERLAAAGSVVAHCPDSNDFLGSGGMPVSDVRGRRIPVAIGTDVAAGRSFRVPRILSSAYDNALRQGITLSPAQLLWWGTRGGALALGHADTGQVARGMQADLCLFDAGPWAEDAAAVIASLLFDHDAGGMRCTWVRGRQVHPAPG
ncbi:MAG: guanine deaminase [Myxococcales bacterium]|nr:guanine deaminase [Myxococcales bacterium]